MEIHLETVFTLGSMSMYRLRKLVEILGLDRWVLVLGLNFNWDPPLNIRAKKPKLPQSVTVPNVLQKHMENTTCYNQCGGNAVSIVNKQSRELPWILGSLDRLSSNVVISILSVTWHCRPIRTEQWRYNTRPIDVDWKPDILGSRL